MTPKMKAKHALKRGRYSAVLIYIILSLVVLLKQAYFGLVILLGMLLYVLWHLQRVEKLLDGVEETR